MLTLEKNKLVVRFPEVSPYAACRISFKRTLRIPDDNRVHALPPNLGDFPLFHVEDYAGKLPAAWAEHGGIFMPMHQAEAMWINFTASYPFAVKIATGKINAVSGEAWDPRLKGTPSLTPNTLRQMPGQKQDYLTLPNQPWLDGFNVGNDNIRQFVAMPQGAGYTVEEQLTGEAVHGGLQIIVYPLLPEFFTPPPLVAAQGSVLRGVPAVCPATSFQACGATEMGLGAGGVLKQKVYQDSFGLEKWDQQHSARCFVHLLNAMQFEQVTGQRPPTVPPTAAHYAAAGLPWFQLYDEHQPSVPGSAPLQQIDSIAALGHKKGEAPLPENHPVQAPVVKGLNAPAGVVSEGRF